MSRRPEDDILKVIVKSMVTSLREDLTEYAFLRKACRKHLFLLAEVRHEPTRLINASVWGSKLFPDNLVKEAIDNAAKLNLNLRRRWGMVEKRKFTEGSGPQPKNKRFRRGSFHPGKAQQSQQPQFQAPRDQAEVATTSFQSPAFNPLYEGHSTTFRAAYNQRRGGRGRAGRGRGRSFSFQHRGRGQRRGAQRRGAYRGRGNRQEQAQ